MKLVILFAVLAFAAAGPIQGSQQKHGQGGQSKNEFQKHSWYEPQSYGQQYWPQYGKQYSTQYGKQYVPQYGQQYQPYEQKSWTQYGQQYWPYQQQYKTQVSPFEVPQYIAYELHQAQQNGYTVGQVESYFLEQGYPQFIAHYFAEQYEAFKNQPWGNSPYQTYQYYHEQTIPQNVHQYFSQQIPQAYQQYQQYLSKNGQYVWKQESTYPQSLSQYVAQQSKYYTQNEGSYLYASQQLQQALQYSQNVLQYLKNHDVPKEVYQYFYQQLLQGQQYTQKALEVYQKYQTYQEYQVPHYVAQYFFEQVQEAYQYFHNVYEYIQQQQTQGTWPQYVFQQVQYAYQAVQNAYQVYQKTQLSQSYSGLNYYSTIKQVQQYIQNIYQYTQGQSSFPHDSVFAKKLTQAYEIYQTVQKFFLQENLPESEVYHIWQQVQQANQYLLEAYEIAQQEGYQYILQQLQYALKLTKNLQYSGQYGYENQGWQSYSQYQPWQHQKYEQSYPSQKQDFDQSWIQKYLTKDIYYPSYYKYQGQYQGWPHTQYGFYEPYSYSKQSDSQDYGYYGPFSSTSQYGPYQYGYYGRFSGNQSYKPYQWGLSSQSSYPYYYSQVAASVPRHNRVKVTIRSRLLSGTGHSYSRVLQSSEVDIRLFLKTNRAKVLSSSRPPTGNRRLVIIPLSQPGQVEQAVKDAIDIGYRHIDCAFIYGNEKEVGAAIKAKIADGTVKREDLWITSKLWNTYHRPDLVEKNVRLSLDDLGLDYLDLYLIHWPMAYKEDGEKFPKDAEGNILFSDVDYLDTWKAMEELLKKGLVKSIGLSNFNKAQITRVLEKGSIKPAVLQIECHPYLNQTKLIDFAKSKGIAVTAYSPLGSPDRPWAKPGDPQLLEDPKLVELAKKYKKTPAQVLLRYQIDRGIIVIPKSVTKSRIQQNFEIFDFKLTSKDIEYLNTFDCNGRFCPLTAGLGHKYHPFEKDEY